MTARDEVHLLSGAYALGAVDAEEARLVEAAMAESEELRHEIVGLSDTAVALGLAVPAQNPPPALRASLLAAIESLPQEPVAPEARPDVARAAHVAPRRRRRMRRLPAVLLTGAVAAILLFTGGALVQRAMVEPQLSYSALVAATDHQQRTATVIGGGVATVDWSRSVGATAVTVKDVRLPSGQVLQLWTVRDGVATSAGVFRPESDQQYELLHTVPAVGQQLAVSVEPAGGSTTPTKVVASVALKA